MCSNLRYKDRRSKLLRETCSGTIRNTVFVPQSEVYSVNASFAVDERCLSLVYVGSNREHPRTPLRTAQGGRQIGSGKPHHYGVKLCYDLMKQVAPRLTWSEAEAAEKAVAGVGEARALGVLGMMPVETGEGGGMFSAAFRSRLYEDVAASRWCSHVTFGLNCANIPFGLSRYSHTWRS